jgi:hypothetical protein
VTNYCVQSACCIFYVPYHTRYWGNRKRDTRRCGIIHQLDTAAGKFIYHTSGCATEQSPSLEADNYSAGQEIPRLLWSPKFHYRVHNSLPLVRTLSQVNPVYIFLPYFPRTHSNITSPSTPRSFELSLPFRFSDQNFLCIFHRSHACYMPRTSLHLDFLNQIIFDEAYKL